MNYDNVSRQQKQIQVFNHSQPDILFHDGNHIYREEGFTN